VRVQEFTIVTQPSFAKEYTKLLRVPLMKVGEMVISRQGMILIRHGSISCVTCHFCAVLCFVFCTTRSTEKINPPDMQPLPKWTDAMCRSDVVCLPREQCNKKYRKKIQPVPDDAKSYVSKCHNVQSKSFSDIKCANMSDMFEGAESFRQDVASWGSGWFGTRFAWYDECDDGL
jgi:hypothetical protein